MEHISILSKTEIETLEELDRLCVSFGSLGAGGFMEIFSWHPTRRVGSFRSDPHEIDPVGKSLRLWDHSGSLGHITVPASSEQLYSPEGKRICHEIHQCLSRLQFENQRANQRRFLNGLLHDVRGPLRRVGSIATFLSGSNELPGELHGCLDKEILSSEWVLKQAGVVAATLRPWKDDRCDPCQAWTEATYRAQHLHGDMPVEFVMDCDYSGLASLSEDSLSELFVQLIHNSLKFGCSPCRINVSIKLGSVVDKDRGEMEKGLLIQYHDNGSSFDPQNLPKLFQPFYRGHPPDFVGAGLGLFACRQITRRARGSMEVHQDPQSRALHLTLWFPSV
jgi:signal transduction histidine kinase